MASEQPFAGLLVLELASVLAGPSVGQFFAELGARVLKIENTGTRGDVTRNWKTATEALETDISAYFSCANWGKESVALNLKSLEGRRLLYQLVDKADVVIASYKPGDAEKLQVDYKTLSERNPKLLYGHITGYGPENSRAGYDAVIQAESGLMYINGQPESEPTKLPVAFVDLLAAHQLKEGLLTALYLREKTGRGKLVEISLLDAALTSLANQGANCLVAGFNPQRAGSEHPNIVPYGTIFQTADQKQLILAIGDDRQFGKLCDVLGAPALAQDERYRQNASRVKNRETLNEKLRNLIAQLPLARLLADLEARFVPAGAVKDVATALSGPAAENLMLYASGSPLKGMKTVGFRLAKVRAAPVLPPPGFGQHTFSVLQAYADVPETTLKALQTEGILFQRPAAGIKDNPSPQIKV